MSAGARDAAELLGARHGLRFDGVGADRLRRALEATAAAQGRPPEAVASAARDDDAVEGELLDRATLPETSWFRDPPVFARVVAEVAAAARRAGAQGRPVRCWSAGCAHGQEAWSLAAGLLEAGVGDLEVVATDLAPAAVARARAATYDERELRGLDDARRARWLRPAPDGRWTVAPELRARVRVLRHGLTDAELPVPAGSCDLVLCRNVLIYLEPEAVRAALTRLRDALRDGGLLVLGAGESLLGAVEGLHVRPLGPGAFAYEKGERRREARPGSPRRRATDVGWGERAAEDAAVAEGGVAAEAGGAAAGGAGAAAGRGDTRPTAADQRAEGEAAAARGDHHAAAAAFRHAAALAPDDPLAHLGLGLALEALGDPGAARAFRAAAAALDRGGPVLVAGELGGFAPEALARLLAHKLLAHGAPAP